jgi:pimeloyl-ACP methyl ester carboxylesterase
MPFAPAKDGVRLYYEVSGAGEPLLLIAGQANDHYIWNLVRGDFARHYQVIAYDQRGTGQSDKPEQPPYSTQGFAQDAVAILNHLVLPRAHVYGISMGGAVGQWMGIDHADRIGALVLGCSSPGKAHGVRRSAEVQALLAQPDQLKVMDTFFSRRWALPRFFISMRESVKHPMPAYAEQLHANASREHDTWERLPTIKAPTLILHGSDDQVVPVANARLLAERIPGAEIFLVPRGRHLFFIEFQSKVNPVVKQFLRCHPLNH